MTQRDARVSGVLEAVWVVAVAAGLMLVWLGYGSGALRWLSSGLPDHLGAMMPAYGHWRLAAVGEWGVWVRVGVAVVAMIGVGVWSVAGWRWVSGRKGGAGGTGGAGVWRAGWLAGVVVGVVGINATVGHVRAGSASFEKPFTRKGLEYYWDVRWVGDAPVEFVRTYGEKHARLSHHARTHPPGGVLFLWAGSRMFGEGVGAASWWAVGFGGLGVVGVYWIARRVLGEGEVGWAVGLSAVVPNGVLFGATSMDAVFSVFLLGAVAAVMWAMVADRRGVLAVVVAGGAFWLAAFMTYTAVVVPVLMGVYWVVVRLRRGGELPWGRTAGRALGVAGVAVACQGLAWWVGYDLFGVARAAMERDLVGMGREGRFEGLGEWARIGVGNAMAWGLASGVGLMGLLGVGLVMGWRQRELDGAVDSACERAWCLGAAVGVTVALMAWSTLFTLETERVWMCLTPVGAVAAVGMTRGRAAMWTAWVLLAVQAIVTEVLFDTLW